MSDHNNTPQNNPSPSQQSGQRSYDQPPQATTPSPTSSTPNAYYAPQPGAAGGQPYTQPNQSGVPGGNPFTGQYTYPPQGPNHYSSMPPYPNTRWNTLCIVGFILTFILPPVGLVLSIIALAQINRTGEQSKGLAIAGIVISAVFTLLTVAFIAFAIWIIGQVAIHYDDSGSYPEWCEQGLDNGIECRGYERSDYDSPDQDDLTLDQIERSLERYSRTGDLPSEWLNVKTA